MLLKPTADVTVDSTTDEDLDKLFDELDEIDEFEDMGLCYPDGRRFVMLKIGLFGRTRPRDLLGGNGRGGELAGAIGEVKAVHYE